MLYCRRMDMQNRSKEAGLNVLSTLTGASWRQCEDLDLAELDGDRSEDHSGSSRPTMAVWWEERDAWGVWEVLLQDQPAAGPNHVDLLHWGSTGLARSDQVPNRHPWWGRWLDFDEARWPDSRAAPVVSDHRGREDQGGWCGEGSLSDVGPGSCDGQLWPSTPR